MVIISPPTLPDDLIQIQDVYYYTWLKTYPNKKIGIIKEDIEEFFKERNNQEHLNKLHIRLSTLPSNTLFLVAKDENKVIGVCQAIIREKYNQLQSIYILPEYQGKGVGKMFWNKLLNFFEKDKKIIVHVATYNINAISFYTKLGFTDNRKRFTEERHKMPISKVLIPQMEMEIK